MIKLSTVSNWKWVVLIYAVLGLMCFSLLAADGPPGPPPDGKDGKDGKREKPPGSHSDKPKVTGTAVREIDGKTVKTMVTEAKLDLKAVAADQTALRVKNGGQLTVGELIVTKTGDTTSEEESNFFSLNAAVAAWADAKLVINGGSITTDAKGANAIFAWGGKSCVTVKNLKIETTEDSSRGLDATFGGTIEGENLTISTKGAHCAALATDRGEGTIKVKKVTANTAGEGSPGIYSTGNISAADSTFEAAGAEAAVIEGKNSITLNNCELTGNKRCGVMLYQSFSGDAGTGTSVFEMTGGSLTANKGPVFFITNTKAKIKLNNVKLAANPEVLLSAGVDRWGRKGRNGGHLTMTAEAQTLSGNIEVNEISSIALALGKATALTGAVNNAATAGTVELTLNDGSLWTVTADSSVDKLDGATTVAALAARIKSGGHTVYYRSKSGLFADGKTYDLDGGGKLVYKEAPKVEKATAKDDDEREHDGPPGGGTRPSGPPPGGGSKRGN